MTSDDHPPEHRAGALAKQAQEIGHEEFCMRYPGPALMRLSGGAYGVDDTTGLRTRLDSAGADVDRSMLGVTLDAKVWWVRRADDEGRERVTVGRSLTNDIAVRDSSISKLHAYLAEQPNGWVIADAGSRHGVTVENETVGPGETRLLWDRSVIGLGQSVRLLFCNTETLLEVFDLTIRPE